MVGVYITVVRVSIHSLVSTVMKCCLDLHRDVWEEEVLYTSYK